MTVWLLPLTAILPQTSWDLLILPLYTHNLPLAGGIEPPTKGPHSPPPQAAGQPERFSCIFNAGLIPNIPENPRNRKHPKRGRKRLFNAAIHALRMRVERTFAWEDKFKRLLLRFERIQHRHYGMKLLAYTLINLRA